MAPIKRKGEDQDKNRGSYVTKFKEEIAKMRAASLSRQQGRSNMTSEDLKPKSSGQTVEEMGSKAGPKAMQAKGTERKFASMTPSPEFQTKTRLDGTKYKVTPTNQTDVATKTDRLTATGNTVGGVKNIQKAVEEQKKKKRGQTRSQLYGT